jgi:hypothetical protein
MGARKVGMWCLGQRGMADRHVREWVRGGRQRGSQLGGRKFDNAWDVGHQTWLSFFKKFLFWFPEWGL